MLEVYGLEMKWKHRLYPQGGETHRTEDACEINFETHSFVKAVFFGFSKQATGGRSCFILEVPVYGGKL